MTIVNEIRDIIDLISIIWAGIAGMIVTHIIESEVDMMLIEQRGKSSLGSEMIFYALILGLVVFSVFQVTTTVLHNIREK